MIGDVLILGMARLLVNGFPPTEKRHLQKRSRPRYPIEMFPENPRVDPGVYAELPVSEKAGRHAKELHEIFSSYMVRQKKEVRLGWFSAFFGVGEGAGCIRFAGLGKNLM